MSDDTPFPEPWATVEGLAVTSLSNWLLVGSHYVNMSQAQYTDDDSEKTPPTLKIWFQGNVVKASGADRLAVLAWLAEQVAPPAGV